MTDSIEKERCESRCWESSAPPKCKYTTVEGTVGEMVELLKLHTQVAHGYKGPALTRPKVEAGTSEEVWQVFEQKWKLFKTGVGLETRQMCPQLFNCCEESLQDNLLKEGAKVEDLREEELLMSIKRLAVVPVTISIRRAELLGMAQDVNENTSVLCEGEGQLLDEVYLQPGG